MVGDKDWGHADWGLPDSYKSRHYLRVTGVQEMTAQSAAFADLLVESGLAVYEEIRLARIEKSRTGRHIDEILIEQGILDRRTLVPVMARAWQIAVIDLASDRPDPALMQEWDDGTYLAENWVPVRDQYNGSVLVATARVPDPERAAHICLLIGAPAEFVVATSGDIRAAVERANGRRLPRTGVFARLLHKPLRDEPSGRSH